MSMTQTQSQTQETLAAPDFEPYIPADTGLRELSWLPLILGTLLGIIFGASSLYLVLKVGLTVSASIPVAVISITLFRIMSRFGARDATILENNIVQTAGSAGESIAFGVGVTMPAIMILGFDLEITRVMTVAILGGLLGILMMIPLRRPLIVLQHGKLKYPEGTACAEVLKAGASEESRAASSASAKAEEKAARAAGGGTSTKAGTIFTGFGIGLLYKTLMEAFKVWKDTPEKVFGVPLKAGSISAEISPELLGVGYIIGPYISAVMCAGGVLAYLVLIPLIKFFGDGLSGPLSPGTIPIHDMGPSQIRGAYILYIGAGAVAAGGIISLARSLPTIWHGLKGGLQDLSASKAATGLRPRTDQDIPMKYVLIGVVVLLTAITLVPALKLDLLKTPVTAIAGAVMIVLFGFLFVTVSSRLTGEIGSSSNPISGMTVATLLLTCLIFLILGWTGPTYYVTALSIGAIVCIAASNGGTTSQDLKTGFLVGSTPRLQQIAILVGAFASALFLGPILLKLNDAATVYVPVQSWSTAVEGTPSVSAQVAGGLPKYGGDIRAEGNGYKLLVTDASHALEGLAAGQYLVTPEGKVAYKLDDNFPRELRAPSGEIGAEEKLKGPQAATDSSTYHVWQKSDDVGGPTGKYLVNDAGVPVYLVDPGINGTHKLRPDLSSVTKFDAPKATLMSYIIKGILNRKLPWALVLLGVMIAVVLELSGIPSLAFAVGVYLPISSSTPILIGGLIRLLVDRHTRRRFKDHAMTEAQLVAEGDKSPGVLLASGYIAGGAIAGIIIAFMAGVLDTFSDRLDGFMTEHNPFYHGPYEDLLSLIPFVLMAFFLYWVGRDQQKASLENVKIS